MIVNINRKSIMLNATPPLFVSGLKNSIFWLLCNKFSPLLLKDA